ncbi:DUF4192 family protein [Bifidobacterium tsurumiense]|uniref:DUF4192 family protein n=1 Tax=Bifidobacterium tsurumiense TaxID=356829 RepID=A0A087EI99_9BIFI|nr:DUF4192 family protein [Bifidobacterium tsurumiense]KFJ07500.1 hypothetical protein BITS_0753 [Bifidobacterium tsurumiense]
MDEQQLDVLRDKNGQAIAQSGDPKTDLSPPTQGHVVDEEEMQELMEQLRAQRRAHGMAIADIQWVSTAFEQWRSGLTRHVQALDRASIAALAVGMAQSLAVRDALIVSMVASKTARLPNTMKRFVSRPHDSRNARLMCHLLDEAFNSVENKPDDEICKAGMTMMDAIVDTVPERYGVQPLAVVAYALWWMQDEQADSYARHALALDPRCNLASIVVQALEHGIYPAWCRQKSEIQHGETQ